MQAPNQQVFDASIIRGRKLFVDDDNQDTDENNNHQQAVMQPVSYCFFFLPDTSVSTQTQETKYVFVYVT